MSRILPFVAAVLLSACAMHGRPPNPNHATVIVHNPSRNPVMARVCGPLGCSEYRELRARSASRYYFDASRGQRAVVDARRGSRILTQQPVDVDAGESVHVELRLP